MDSHTKEQSGVKWRKYGHFSKTSTFRSEVLFLYYLLFPSSLSSHSLVYTLSLSLSLSLSLFFSLSLIHPCAYSIVETAWKWIKRKHLNGDSVQGLNVQYGIITVLTTVLCWSSHQHSRHTNGGEGFTDEISPQGNLRSTQSTIHP